MPDTKALSPAERKLNLYLEAGKAFTPSSPVNEEDLFAGRWSQMRQIIDVLNQRGQHAIIFGERGVGKTSLANIFSARLRTDDGKNILAPRVNCDSGDSHAVLWRKILSQVDLSRRVRRAGFGGTHDDEFVTFNAADELGEKVTPDDIRRILTVLADEAKTTVMPIIDEFDRLTDTLTKTAIADTIKTLSDHAVDATIVLVGVADSVNELIAEHHSVERALVQIRMPRMSEDELEEILKKGIKRLKMAMRPDAMKYIAWLSRGLPHYTHLLGLQATRAAIESEEKIVSMKYVERAVKSALNQAQQSVQSAYHKATSSPRKDNIYSHVILACALAKTDAMGYFAPVDVRDPLSHIMRKPYDIPSFARHLADFCEPERGPVLQKSGSQRRFRFRFINPLMQPYVTMQGIARSLLPSHPPSDR